MRFVWLRPVLRAITGALALIKLFRVGLAGLPSLALDTYTTLISEAQHLLIELPFSRDSAGLGQTCGRAVGSIRWQQLAFPDDGSARGAFGYWCGRCRKGDKVAAPRSLPSILSS